MKGQLSKHLKYNIVVILSALTIIVPIAAVFGLGYLYLQSRDNIYLIIGTVLILICVAAFPALRVLRVKTRRDVEYDEFGVSKSKGRYEYLSKKERDAMDLQKAMDVERLVSTTALKKMTHEGSKNPNEDLKKMIGLNPVKEKVEEMAARMEFEAQERSKSKKKGKDLGQLSGRHMVFFGSPGTGKTTVARIIAGFLYKYGYIKENKCVEIDGNFLKAGTDSALKTELVLREAYGGVLFIDEAYALMESGDGSGDQVIATLIKQMEDKRDRFILILAGYTNEMRALIAANPGFESRIKEYLSFPDYSTPEMFEIANLMAKENKFEISRDAYHNFESIVNRERKLQSFGNGRTARNILDKAIDRHTLNIAHGKYDQSKRYILMPDDFTNLQLGGITYDLRDSANESRPMTRAPRSSIKRFY